MIPFELLMSALFGLMAGVVYYAILSGAQQWKSTPLMLTFLFLNAGSGTASAGYAAYYVFTTQQWIAFTIPILFAVAGFLLFACYQYAKPYKN